MNAHLDIVSPGAYAALQDFGRFGLRRIGIPWAGVLDRRLMRIANRLAGNDERAAVIECFDGGLQLAARDAPIRIAVAGHALLERQRDGERTAVPAWRSMVLERGDVLRVVKLAHGRLAVVAVAGLEVPLVMGSASTYARAHLGGWRGRALAAGDRLPAASAQAGVESALPQPPARDTSALRIIPGPQHDLFEDGSLQQLADTDYRVSPAADRMGVRLDGPPLRHVSAQAREIVSDAIVPGAIQVPGNGQPIVLLADAHTAGGYPKIATVASADLARLADLRPGETVRFRLVEVAEAEQHCRAAEHDTLALLDSIRPLADDGLDLAALYSQNLVGGVIDALSPEYRPDWRD